MDADILLRRLPRTAAIVCLASAAIAVVVMRGRPEVPLAVLAGGVLIGISYWSIGSGVGALVDALIRHSVASGTPAASPRLSWTVVKIAGRYALLGLLAYVMIARLRLHPIGLLAGASSVVAAAGVEAVRFLFKKQS